jgi:hypothetical protein
MLTDELMKQSMPLQEVVNELLAFNCVLQTAGEGFALLRGGVAIPNILSQPGAGKTSVNTQFWLSLGWGVITVHLAMKPLEELGGIPEFKDIEIAGKKYPGTVWSLPDLIGQLYQMANNPQLKGLVLCFDDVHLCGSIYLGLMQEFFTERTMRGYKIPSNVAIMLMGNTSNKAGAKILSSAITNRVCQMPVVADYDHWRKNFALGTSQEPPRLSFDPNKLKEAAGKIVSVHKAIVSFLGRDSYKKFFHEEEQVESPWGSPRSWTRFSNWLTCYELVRGQTMPEHHCLYLATGHVGKEGASEFVKYYKIYSKFDLPGILADCRNYILPDSPVDQYALAYAMTGHYCDHKQRKDIVSSFAEVVLKYFDNYKDLALMIVREILDTEKITHKKSLYMDLTMELNRIRPGITHELLSEVNKA